MYVASDHYLVLSTIRLKLKRAPVTEHQEEVERKSEIIKKLMLKWQMRY